MSSEANRSVRWADLTKRLVVKANKGGAHGAMPAWEIGDSMFEPYSGL